MPHFVAFEPYGPGFTGSSEGAFLFPPNNGWSSLLELEPLPEEKVVAVGV